MVSKNAVLLLTLFVGIQPAFSAPENPEDSNSSYFTIQDVDRKQSQWMDPSAALEEGFATVVQAAADRLNLLKWVRHEGMPPQSPEPYNRKKHFGTWVNDPNDESCFNTRAKVLVRDSTEPVTFKEHNHCVVESGRWEDPYSGTVRTSARDVQIDHVVPLKNAFISGAWTWNSKKRCLYANFINNKFHLLAVDGHENMSKGDSAPDQYIPPNGRYVCKYLQEWLKIKIIWNLEMTQPEAEAIRQNVSQYGCDLRGLTILQTDLKKQRVATEDLQTVCAKMAVRLDQASTKDHSKEASSPMDESL